MNNPARRWTIWAIITLLLGIIFVLIPTTETLESAANSVRINTGWTQVTGELLTIKCADREPVKIEYRGAPFAHQETEFICTGENEIQANRSNTVAVFLNVLTAGIITGAGIGLAR